MTNPRLEEKLCSGCGVTKPRSEFHVGMNGRWENISFRCRPCMKEYQKRPRNLASKKRHSLKTHYKLSLEQWNRLYEMQNGLCASCKLPSPNRSLHVDHDHKTGQVRSLLCGSCNAALGLLHESPDKIRMLAEYAEYTKAILPGESVL